MKKIVLTGGGSAGHVTPNLALIPYLQEQGFEVSYIGTTGIEKTLVKNIDFYEIVAGKLRRYFSKENFSDIFKLFKGYKQSKVILKKLKPDIVFSKGGFVSVPVVYAAHKLKIPVVIHESDYTEGFSNKLCRNKAKKLCLSFENPNRQGNTVYTGSPIRREILKGNKSKANCFLMFNNSKKVLLIMGGSLGAQALNDVIDSSFIQLCEKYNIIHLRGKGKLNTKLKNENYRQYEFLDNMEDIYAATDYVVCRSGANSVFELLELKLPAIYIPLPLSASRGDQILNAKYCVNEGYALMLEQENLNSKTLLENLADLEEKSRKLIDNMSLSKAANGTQNVLNVIYECVGK